MVYYQRYNKAWMGSRKFCQQIPRKQLLMNTKGSEEPLHTEQRQRGIVGDFLTLVTKDQRHEYLTWYYQMKGVKVWQVSLKLDEQSFFKTRILQWRLSSRFYYYHCCNYYLYHSKCPHNCLGFRTPISPSIRSSEISATDHCYHHLINETSARADTRFRRTKLNTSRCSPCYCLSS